LEQDRSDGTPRKLHIEESMVSIDFNDFEPGVEHIGEGASPGVRIKVEGSNFSAIPAASEGVCHFCVVAGAS
jgi:hypothetical protein